ncbi:putative CorA family magnesium ion transporterr [Heterostelium album PN500]|uniref:Putative CorA family magnesium ion transporterr n=1 Tax=Heterostelium pallidum (strain ATCC 26659 / Pp 5 / PN500) TaxID=670386 RepID=D3BPH0_HETP5|nr:putative CorA family magnesium ion transporterr [Heterostelium album PN500]EFA76688.1 putative CorA family magnesium ion transporterr [Heterostelium album PN500]|eukprot:XP_020428820.1 putative CorA family magnesium ion transporterr [Heterostelium album PN500]
MNQSISTSVSSGSLRREKKIHIINELKDQDKEYTFQELIDFSHVLVKRDQSFFNDLSNSTLLSPPLVQQHQHQQPTLNNNNNSSNNNNIDNNHSKILIDEDINNNNNNDNNNKNDVYWLDMEGLDDDEISVICKIFAIHHLTYEDIITQDSSEKSEEYSHYLFVSTSEICYNDFNVLETSNIYLVIFKSFVLVFHSRPVECFEAVMKSFRYLDNNQIPTSHWVLCSFLDAIHGIYSTLADTLMVEVNILDEYTMRDEIAKSELYIRLGRAVRKATNLLSWLFIKNDVMSSLLRDNISDTEAVRHLNNIKDRLYRLQQKIKLAEELLENIGNIYISKVSLVMDEESHTLNISMSRIATLTTIFMPMTWLSGVFGMNIKMPGLADAVDNYSWFSGIISAMIAFAFIFLVYSYKKGYI